MLNVIIWGAGKNCKVVLEAIRKDKCNYIGIVDTNKELHQKKYAGKWPINGLENITDKAVDYIIISVRDSIEILRQCKKIGIARDKIIDYWNSDDEYDFIDGNVKKIFELERELKKYKRQLHNMPYELGLRTIPTIKSSEVLLEIIINEKKSLSRFGDGELEIMQGRERPWFQTLDNKLSERLKEIFNSNDDRIIIALADNFGNLDCYTECAADGIRKYLDNGNREDLMGVIDINRIYYNAYVTRPYIIYRDKKYAKIVFNLFKKVLQNRDLLIVEGKNSKFGVGNDLYAYAGKIRRIICPEKNAFSCYEKILHSVKRSVSEDELVLTSLGPTATVLAYDLGISGIQTLDIGQIDNEYEWFIRKAEERIEIPGKCVTELSWCHYPENISIDNSYEEQVIEKIGVD